MNFRILLPLIVYIICKTGFITTAQAQIPGLTASYQLNGNAREQGSDSLHGKSTGIKPGTDRFGKEGKSVVFARLSKTEYGSITLPLDISPDKFPALTICFWVKAAETYLNLSPLRSGDEKSRGILTDNYSGAQRWSASAGKDGLIGGPVVLKDQWTFIAVIYDGPNEQARLIVNNEIFGGRARLRKEMTTLALGSFNGMMDELQFYNRALTLQELEFAYGKSIDINAEIFQIEDRSAYRKRMADKGSTRVRPGDRFVVGYEELMIRDSVNSPNTLCVFREGDTVTVLASLENEWFEVKNQQNQTGCIRGHTLESVCFKTGNSKTIFRFVNWLAQIFRFNKFSNLIFVALFTIVLVLAIRSRALLNNWFERIGKKDPREASGSKSAGTPVSHRITVFDKYFPVEYPKWWIISPGLVFGLMILGGSLWDTGETEWYFNEGATIFPHGFTLPIHWVLWSFTIGIIILIIGLMLESLTIAGPYAGLLRIVMLMVINTMAVVVAFYLSAALLIAVIGFILFIILSMAIIGRRRY